MQAQAHLPHVGVNLRCVWKNALKLLWSPLSLSPSCQLPFSPGMRWWWLWWWGVFSARHRTQVAAVCTVLSRTPESTDHLYGARGVTTGRQSCWPRRQECPRSRACPSPKQQPRFPFSLSNLVRGSGVLCCSSRRLLAFNSRTQPTVEYHLLALPAASTRYSCMRQGKCVNLPAANEPACMSYCKLDPICLLGAASLKA